MADPTWCADHLDLSAERFMSRVDSTGPCWLWQGPPGSKGYGYARLAGARKHTTAHRVSYMLATGQPIPAGLMVRHACDTPRCVFPGHLVLGTARDNSADMVERGRHRNNATGTLQPGASTVRPGRQRVPTRKRTRVAEAPPVDLAALAAQRERRERYGA